MADLKQAVAENVGGAFFVDSTCIDCDTCRRVAPEVFAARADGQSFVAAQPVGDAQRTRAQMALLACPTASIGTRAKEDLSAGLAALPERVEPDLYWCGYTSKKSFGAWSWLLVREGGNVLVDSPRAAPPLLAAIERLGGARWLFLSHQDDVADHAALRARLGCERVLHRADVGPDTAEVELQIEGRDPVQLAGDLLVIPTPGHTEGSACLLYADRLLFTGDHLWKNRFGRLHMSRDFNWHSWEEQVASTRRLLDYEFTAVYPGHGRPYVAESAAAMRKEIEALLARSG